MLRSLGKNAGNVVLRKSLGVTFIKSLSTTLPSNSDPLPNKICKNCKHYLVEPVDPTYSKWLASLQTTAKVEVDLVTGKKEFSPDVYHYCSIAREDENLCGKDGNKYEYTKRKNYRILEIFRQNFNFDHPI